MKPPPHPPITGQSPNFFFFPFFIAPLAPFNPLSVRSSNPAKSCLGPKRRAFMLQLKAAARTKKECLVKLNFQFCLIDLPVGLCRELCSVRNIISLPQRIVDGSARKPTLVQVTNFKVEKTYHIAPYLGAYDTGVSIKDQSQNLQFGVLGWRSGDNN